MDHALLAFDGSDKSREALFVAAYAAARWECRLTVGAVGPPAIARKHLDAARRYLDTREVTANYVHAAGNPGPTLIEQAEAHQCNLLLLGGFGAHPLRQILVGSTVLGVLRAATQPVLICR
jgi:nucleotide-binding universal stress UspA family protein